MKTIILKYPIFASGKGLPEGGTCVANAGEEVKVEIIAGQTYILTSYRGTPIKVATKIT